MNARLPIAVYGTLRPGNGNARLWEGRAEARHDGDAFVLGYALVTNGGFPYAVPATMAQTVVALIVPAATEYDAVLGRMDALEGFTPGARHNHYDRIEVAVMTPDGPVMAWMYVPDVDDHIARLPDVETNEHGQYDWSCRTPRRLTWRR